jgi:glycosyltransferase involved in cell wall biosynthesis
MIERPMGAGFRTTCPVRVLRVIARLNMGGPAHHVGLLGSRLDPVRYETLLLHGEVGGHEDSLEPAVRKLGIAMAQVPGLRPEVRPQDDLRALGALTRAVRRLRPDILHTHTAKAGMLGRSAAVLAGEPRPLIVHTYHGHVLEGYFGPVRNSLYRALERQLAGVSDALIGVSAATVDDLVRLGIAPRERFRVIPIGLELEPFLNATAADGEGFRIEVGVKQDEVLLTWVGRLAPIKRVDVLLRALALARRAGAPVRLALVGDGALRSELQGLAGELGVSSHIYFAGYRADMLPVAAASDVAVLSSDNEGTPVSLIEAGAAGTPAVATRVGGVADVVNADTGLLAPPGDWDGLGRALTALAADQEGRRRMGRAARRWVSGRFSVSRLVSDIDSLYRELIDQSHGTLERSAPLGATDRPTGL